jgi:hypothetical protein
MFCRLYVDVYHIKCLYIMFACLDTLRNTSGSKKSAAKYNSHDRHEISTTSEDHGGTMEISFGKLTVDGRTNFTQPKDVSTYPHVLLQSSIIH